MGGVSNLEMQIRDPALDAELKNTLEGGAVHRRLAAVVAFGLYGIDEIGVEIEDPFGRDANDLPIDELLETLRQSVQETMVTTDGAPAQTPTRQETPLAR